MLDALPAIAEFLWNLLTQVFDLYTTCSVLAGFFTLWLVDRMFGIFDVIKHR